MHQLVVPATGSATLSAPEKLYFCDQPHADYAHVVLAPRNSNQSLWSLAAITSVCRLDQVLRSSRFFPSLCQTGRPDNQCCSSWSIGHYVALLTNRSSCDDLTEADVSVALDVLDACSKHYHGLQLSANCDSFILEGNVLHYL